MVIYLYLFIIIVLLLYLFNLTKIKWNFDYYKQLEKQCILI
jgi:hypothetical protein